MRRAVPATLLAGLLALAWAAPAEAYRAFVGINAGSSLEVIDTEDHGAETEKIDLEDVAKEILMSPDGARAYIAANDEIVTLNTRTNTRARADIKLGPRDAYIVGMALTPNGSRLYVSVNNGPFDDDVTVVNTANGNVITTFPLGGVFPRGVAITPDGALAYVVKGGTDSLMVIDVATNTVVVPDIAVDTQPNEIAITPDGSKAYVSSQFANTVTPVSLATNTAGAPIAMAAADSRPTDLAITPNGSRVYVGNENSTVGGIPVIDTATDTLADTLVPGTAVWGLAVTPDGSRLYASLSFDNRVRAFGLPSNSPVGSPVATGRFPGEIAFTAVEGPPPPPEPGKAVVVVPYRGTVKTKCKGRQGLHEAARGRADPRRLPGRHAQGHRPAHLREEPGRRDPVRAPLGRHLPGRPEGRRPADAVHPGRAARLRQWRPCLRRRRAAAAGSGAAARASTRPRARTAPRPCAGRSGSSATAATARPFSR